MPITGGTDPASLLMQRMGGGATGGPPGPPGPPGAQPGGPPGFTGNAAGTPGSAPQPPQMNPQIMKLAQLAQRLLMQQQGTDQIKKFMLQVIAMIKSANASQFMQNPKATKKFATAMENISAGVGDLSDTSPSSGGDIQSAVMSLMQPPLGPASGAGGPGGGPPGPQPPAYPLG